MTRTDLGTAAVLKKTTRSGYKVFPDSKTFFGKGYTIMLVSWTNHVDVCVLSLPVFGLVGQISLLSQNFIDIATSCFAVAKVKLSLC
jgi:hypothetical protein